MMKKYKKSIILGCIVILLPMLLGVLLWNQLPDEIPTHFDSNNVPNDWSSKGFTVFGIPSILVLLHFFTVAVTASDPKRQNISSKLFSLIIWIIPIVSLFVVPACYAYALGFTWDMDVVLNLLMGIIFLIIGNYMHKVKHNYTVGIKIPWTLHSEENWNRTHRFASWLWMLAGIVFLINIFLKTDILVFAVIITTVAVPMIYSFVLYKKGI